jgi:hypothetical protein
MPAGRRPTTDYAPPSKAVARLLDRITATLREYRDDGSNNTDLLRAAGNDVADLRGLFVRNDAPDWSGRSREYQSALSEVYNRLNLRGRERQTLAYNLRFHTGNIVRAREDADELEAAGLDTITPAARKARSRQANAAIAAAAGVQAGTPESLPKALAFAATLLEFAETLDAAALTKQERSAARALVGDCRKSLDALGKAL